MVRRIPEDGVITMQLVLVILARNVPLAAQHPMDKNHKYTSDSFAVENMARVNSMETYNALGSYCTFNI